jgi:hypothetical protein
MIAAQKLWDIDDIRMADRAAGRFFFEPGTMRVFRSRIGRRVYQGPGGIFFITSEQFIGSTGATPRKYTVRRFVPKPVDIRTVGGFNNLAYGQAQLAATLLAAGDPHAKIAERTLGT